MVNVYAPSGLVNAAAEVVIAAVSALAIEAVAAATRAANQGRLYRTGRLPLGLAVRDVGLRSATATLVRVVMTRTDDAVAGSSFRSRLWRAAMVLAVLAAAMTAPPIALTTLTSGDAIQATATTTVTTDAAAFLSGTVVSQPASFVATAVDEVLAGAALGATYGDVCLVAAVGVRQSHDACAAGVPRVILRSALCTATAPTRVRIDEVPSGDVFAELILPPFDAKGGEDFVNGSGSSGWGTVPRSDGVAALRGDGAVGWLHRNKSLIILTMVRLTAPHVRPSRGISRTIFLPAEESTCVYHFDRPKELPVPLVVARACLTYRAPEVWELDSGARFSLPVLAMALAYTRLPAVITVYRSPVVVPLWVIATTGCTAAAAVFVLSAVAAHGRWVDAGPDPDLSPPGLVRLLGHVVERHLQVLDVGGGGYATTSAPHLVVVVGDAPWEGLDLTVDTAWHRAEAVAQAVKASVAPMQP